MRLSEYFSVVVENCPAKNNPQLTNTPTFDKAKIVVEEMVRSGCLELMRRKVIASHITVTIGYSKDCHAPTGGRVKIGASTNLPKKIMPSAMRVFEQTTDRNSLIRRVSIGFDGICDEGCEGYDLFTDWEEVERQKRLARATLELQSKFGKNALLMASDLQEGATLIMRNKLIGGHNSGNDE